jgi:hypothetical protein
MIIMDLETDGLLDTVTKIHCAVAYNTTTEEIVTFTPDTVKDIPAFMDTLKAVSFHNYFGFDGKVLKKILNYTYKGKIYDTLLLSRILFPDLDAAHYLDDMGADHGVKSPHSVESWGLRFGHPKVKHDDWSKFSPEMLHRCTEDTKIQGELWVHLAKAMKDYGVRDSRIANRWQAIIDMEQYTWELMEAQADYGWEFDLELAYTLVDRLTETCTHTSDKLVPVLPPRVIQLTKTESGATKCFKANGEHSESTLKWFDRDSLEHVKGDFCRVKFEDFNIGSSAQVKDYLLQRGWEPKEWNFKKDKHNKPVRDERRQLIKTSPKSPKTSEDWEEIAHRLNNPDIALLAEYNKASHRLSQIKGLIHATRPDHRIEARANTCSTNTARMAHRIVVNIPKADSNVYYGKELRSLFRAGVGNVLVGCDASAIEARCEAHYISDYDLSAANELIAGDIHTTNAEIFRVDRNTAKSGKYAILYGCSPTKLAATLGKPIGQATQIYNDYWDGNPALKQFKEDLEAEFDERGYLVAIDGRPLTIRYKHAIINTLLQSCGAIIMKQALCIFNTSIKKLGYEAKVLGFFHDEFQIECPDREFKIIWNGEEKVMRYADVIGKTAVRSIKEAGRVLKMKVELSGEYKIGKNWSLTH